MNPIICNFNPKRDIAPVEQDGYISLARSFAEGSVPSVVMESSLSEGSCDETDSLFPSPRDTFEAIQQSHTVQKILSESSNSPDE